MNYNINEKNHDFYMKHIINTISFMLIQRFLNVFLSSL